jgi:hypothetical protein
MKRLGEVWFTTSDSEIPPLPFTQGKQGKFPTAGKSIQPTLNCSPTHSTLLTNLQLEIERLKPMHSGARTTSFEAHTLR